MKIKFLLSLLFATSILTACGEVAENKQDNNDPVEISAGDDEANTGDDDTTPVDNTPPSEETDTREDTDSGEGSNTDDNTNSGNGNGTDTDVSDDANSGDSNNTDDADNSGDQSNSGNDNNTDDADNSGEENNTGDDNNTGDQSNSGDDNNTDDADSSGEDNNSGDDNNSGNENNGEDSNSGDNNSNSGNDNNTDDADNSGEDNNSGDDNNTGDQSNSGDDNNTDDADSSGEDNNSGDDNNSGNENNGEDSNSGDNDSNSGEDNNTGDESNSGDDADSGDDTNTGDDGETDTGDNTGNEDNTGDNDNNNGDNGNDVAVIIGGDQNSLEPALANRSDIIFYGSFEENFNNESWENLWGIPWTNGEDRYELARGIAGDNALRIRYPEGGFGTSAGGQFPVLMREMSAIQDQPEKHQLQSAHLRYYIQFEPGFSFSKGGKMPGLIGGGKSWQRSGGRQPDGTNGWTLRFMWREDGELFVYAYVPKSGNGKWGYKVWGQYIPTGIFMQPGQWYQIEQFVDVGTPGNDDGKLTVWVNGEQRLNITDMRFWDVENENGPIGGLYFSTFHGGSNDSWAPSNDSSALFDGFAIATDARIPSVTARSRNVAIQSNSDESTSLEIAKAAVASIAEVIQSGDSQVSGDNTSGYEVDTTMTHNHYGSLTLMASAITLDSNTGKLCTGSIEVGNLPEGVMTISFPDCDNFVLSYQGNANTYSQ